MAKDKNGKEIKVGDFVKGRDGRSWKVKRIVGDELEFEFTAAGSFPASEYTLFNSALNAKFKVGDVVEVVGSGLASKGWVGTVKSVGTGGRWNIKVQFPAGKYSNDYGEYSENELYKVRNSATVRVVRPSERVQKSSDPVVANALAWKARNATPDERNWGGPRFKVGERVKLKDKYYLPSGVTKRTGIVASTSKAGIDHSDIYWVSWPPALARERSST